MSSSNSSPVDHFTCGSGRGCCKGNWSCRNIVAMVIAFVLFWPVGLVVLYWNIRGNDVRDLPNAVKEKWNTLFNGAHSSSHSPSGNSVFNEFQETQHERINEIKEEIKKRASRFNVFKSDVKRRADEKEFQDFMSNNPDSDKK